MFKQQTLENKVAIVTGGSRGIGRAITELLAQEGGEIIFFYHRNHALAAQFQDEAQGQGLNGSGCGR
jgi:NAD(P)-dependent dehydrogenase (short-subunit alcohol dehydrogenase family)